MVGQYLVSLFQSSYRIPLPTRYRPESDSSREPLSVAPGYLGGYSGIGLSASEMERVKRHKAVDQDDYS